MCVLWYVSSNAQASSHHRTQRNDARRRRWVGECSWRAGLPMTTWGDNAGYCQGGVAGVITLYMDVARGIT